MQGKEEVKHHPKTYQLNITPNITLVSALDMYEYRIKQHGEAAWEGNVSYLCLPELKQKFIEISDGDFLHSEMLVAMRAACYLPNSPYNLRTIDTIIRAVKRDVNRLKKEYNNLSSTAKQSLIDEVKKNPSLDEGEEEKSAQQLYISKKISDLSSLAERDKVLDYFFRNVAFETIITTERCPCNLCKKTFNSVAISISKFINFNYLVSLQGKTRKEVAEELKNQYSFCKEFHSAYGLSIKIDSENDFKEYMNGNTLVREKFNSLLIDNPEFKDLIIKELYYSELQSLKKLKEFVQNICTGGLTISQLDLVKRDLILVLKSCDNLEVIEKIKVVLKEIEEVSSTNQASSIDTTNTRVSGFWALSSAQKDKTKKVIANSTEALNQSIAIINHLINKKNDEYNKQLLLSEKCLNQFYQTHTSTIGFPNIEHLIKNQIQIKENLNNQKSDTAEQTTSISLRKT